MAKVEKWFYQGKDKARNGPIKSRDDMRKLFESKEITTSTLVWKKGMGDWSPLGEVTDLMASISLADAKPKAAGSAPMPPPPAPKPARRASVTKVAGGFKVEAVPEKITKPKETNVGVGTHEELNATALWKAMKTLDGDTYYVNESTGDLTWEKPKHMRTQSDMKLEGDWRWAKHPEHGYVALNIQGEPSGATVDGIDVHGKTITVKTKDLGDRVVQTSMLRNLLDDLVQMTEVHEASIVYTLRERFYRDKIYTSVADILVSMNPFKMLKLYTPEVIEQYAKAGKRSLAPHVYSIASSAYIMVSQEKKPVSILISGESGAGKTEATKQCLQYLSEVAGSDTGVEQKVLSANPVLEAFGNAKTPRNNNSSRFGKYMVLKFTRSSKIESCNIINYLLEKSRLVKQGPGDRNYHIFYFLLKGAPDELKTKLLLKGRSAEEFYYMNQSGCIDIGGRWDDSKEFHLVETSFSNLKFDSSEIMCAYEVAAIVLHLGNIEFEEAGEGSRAKMDGKSGAALKDAASLIGVTPQALADSLVINTLTMRGETMRIPLNLKKAKDSRDALTKALYGRMFNWLVERVNKSMAQSGGTSKAGAGGQRIGILDIFGFEIFKKNTFEQLCINFCNEKLQQHFNEHTFRLEEDTYKAEQIKFEHIEYIDNQPMLDLIEKKPAGLLVLLDDECRVPGGKDSGFYKKICQKHKGNPRFTKPRIANDEFTVSHYAGDVVYTVDGWYDKNKDTLNADLADCMATAKHAHISGEWFKGGAAADTARKDSQSGFFRKQLKQLMVMLRSTEPSYIRCIKSNSKKAANIFEGQMCLDQLRYSGVFEAVSIRKQGFPFRYTHEDFFKRYRLMCKKDFPANKMPSAGQFKPACEKLIKLMSKKYATLSECRMGKTMVLYRSSQHRPLELERNIIVETASVSCQAVGRGFRARKHYAEMKRVAPILKAAIDKRELPALEAALKQAEPLFFKMRLHVRAEGVCKALREEKEIEAKLAKIVDTDPDKNFDAFKVLIDRMDSIMKDDPLSFQSAISKKAKKKFQSVADRRECKRQLIEGVEKADKALLLEALSKIEKIKAEWGDFAPTEERAAKDMLHRIEQEEKLTARINSGVSGGRVTGVAGELDHKTINVKDLENALNSLTKFGAKSAPAQEALKIGTIFCKLRKAIKLAIQAHEHMADPHWQEVRKMLMAANEAGIEGNDELELIKDDMALRAAVEDVMEKLTYAIETFDEDWLVYGLEQAVRLKMETSADPDVRKTTLHAKDVLSKMRSVKKTLKAAIDNVDYVKLENALELASSFGVTGPIPPRGKPDYSELHFKYNTQLVIDAQKLYGKLRQLITKIKDVLKLVIVEEMKSIVAECRKVNLQIPEVAACEQLLAMPKEKLLQRQLKAAIQYKDTGRVTKITVEIKRLFFEQAGGMFQFAKYPNLKKPAQFARRFGLTHESLKNGMLSWTSEPLHTSLTKMDDPRAKKAATKMFKNIMGFMGDRHYSYPTMLAHDLLKHGILIPELRDEIYCQLMKQLIDNPSPASKSTGISLLMLCLECFPPSDELENYLELFLRNAEEMRCVRLLHQIVYTGAVAGPPEVDEIEERTHRKTARRSVAMRPESDK